MPAGPAPQPVTPTTPAAGTLYASGTQVVPVSGVSGTRFYGGPWTIITQTLNIDYGRVPRLWLSGTDLDLDSASKQYAVAQTKIAATFTADVTIVSSSDYYSTSSVYQQPQTFEIYPVSADHLGNTYGALNASCMGPMGSIKTKMPFILRKLREASDDQNYPLGTSSIKGSNFQFGTSSIHAGFNSQDQDSGLYNFPSWSWHNGSPDHGMTNPNWGPFSWYSTIVDPYTMQGGYSTSGEYIMGVYTFIDSVGTSIRDVNVESVPSQRSLGAMPYQEIGGFIGIPTYDPNRHDFT